MEGGGTLVKKNRTIAGLQVIEVEGDPEGLTFLFLHGFGANGLNLLSLSTLHTTSPRPTWLFPDGPLEVPFSPSYTGRAWFPLRLSATEPGGSPLDLLPEAVLAEARAPLVRLLHELEVPRSRLLLGGFSQGAVVAADLLLREKERVAGLAFLSGTLVCERLWRERAPLHRGTPFFQSHGLYDPLLPIGRAERVATLFQEAGWEGSCLRFPGGHEIPHEVLSPLRTFLSERRGAEGSYDSM